MRAGQLRSELRRWSAVVQRPFSRLDSAVAATPTRGCRPRPRRAGPRSTATRPTAATPPRKAPPSCRCSGRGRSRAALAAAPALSARSYLALNAQTPAGCSLMEWENDDNGRQRWCVRLFQGGGFASPLFDGFDNLYIGQPGAFLSFPVTQWTRWRQPVIGMPSTPRFLGGGQLLVSTHLGQVLVFDAHRGEVVGAPLDLVDGVDPADATRGLADCAPARPGCPVAAAPAFSPATGTVVLGVWQPGAAAAGLVALKYHPGQTPLLSREWTTDAVGAGVISSPVLSADGSTRLRQWPRPTAVGAERRRRKAEMVGAAGVPGPDAARGHPAGADRVGRRPRHPAGGLQRCRRSRRYGVASRRRHPAVVVERGRFRRRLHGGRRPAASRHIAAGVRSGNGRTLNSYPLPAATGYPVGISVGTDRRVVTATSDGQVYSFAPA